ncbi:MAG TPA: hypothetical protein VGJ49_03370 [Gaiellaceae bacterium]
MKEPTYYVQFSSPSEDPSRWHTIARVEGKALADELVRLVEGSYGRTTVTSHYAGRALSRSALRRDGALQHADWEIGVGHHRDYADMLLAKAVRNLGTTPS